MCGIFSPTDRPETRPNPVRSMLLYVVRSFLFALIVYSDHCLPHSDTDLSHPRLRGAIELPPLRDHFKQESLPPFTPRPRELLPSILNHSPPGRSSTLPPIAHHQIYPQTQARSPHLPHSKFISLRLA
ncbi:Pc21g09000 [Penicillium rubens Wisconsin 54-1255]|uniref:Pc21g09000 protein n=1 Tax=Penicillium rubens (strain ATCC 28089 / DSM 1075 / NRRL 1951 / Wisconsin 54-1255) TaxID=500485 RepID=B6HMR8_PENRW|nr:Pc21g09000 [Penicillium rubens Wisconsin 54-1255]